MSVLLSPCPPTKISYSQWGGRYRDLAEWRAGPNAHLIRKAFEHRRPHKGRKGLKGGGFTLSTPCRTEGRGTDGMLRTASGGGQCHERVHGEICGRAEDYKTVYVHNVVHLTPWAAGKEAHTGK